MVLPILVLTVLAVGVLCAVVVTRIGSPGVQDPVNTQSFVGLGTRPVRAEDLEGARFDIAFRGYRMDQVDAVLQRLGVELTERDAEIDRLRSEAEHGNL